MHLVSKGFRYSDIHLPIQSITRSEFNNILNTCGGEQDSQMNLHHYKELSIHVYDYCKSKYIFMDSISSVLSFHGMPSFQQISEFVYPYTPYSPLLRELIMDYTKTHAQTELELVNKTWNSTCEPYKQYQRDLEIERERQLEVERQRQIELERLMEIERQLELERQREEQIKEEMFLQRIRKPYDVSFDLENTSLFPWPLSIFDGNKRRSYKRIQRNKTQRNKTTQRKRNKTRLHSRKQKYRK